MHMPTQIQLKTVKMVEIEPESDVRSRVVCTLGDTIETLRPTNRFINVDLPTLGSPTWTGGRARIAWGQADGRGVRGGGWGRGPR